MHVMAGNRPAVTPLGEIRKELRYKLHEMAAALSRYLNYDLKVSSYKNFEYGATKTIPVEILAAAEQLKHENVRKDGTNSGFIVTVAIRAYRGVMAGTSLNDESYYEPEDYPSEIPSAFIVGGLDKVERHRNLYVSGNSMAPRIFSGDQVVILLDATPRPNTIVFCESPEGRLLIKKLTVEGPRFVLTSYAEDGLNVQDLTGWKIHGHAVAILGDSSIENPRNIEWDHGRPLRA